MPVAICRCNKDLTNLNIYILYELTGHRNLINLHYHSETHNSLPSIIMIIYGPFITRPLLELYKE